MVLFYHKQYLILGLLKKSQLKEQEKKNQFINLKEECLIALFNVLLKLRIPNQLLLNLVMGTIVVMMMMMKKVMMKELLLVVVVEVMLEEVEMQVVMKIVLIAIMNIMVVP
jgi:hypothetical protein